MVAIMRAFEEAGVIFTEPPRPAGLGVSEGVAMARTKGSNPIDAHVGSRMRMRRMMLGMSQESLAASGLGNYFQQVQKYEKGANRWGQAGCGRPQMSSA